MNFLVSLFEFVLHIDKYLTAIVSNYGGISYLILFAIVFAETGFVLTPFLPGDSLLFAAGSLAAIGSFNIVVLLLILILAAVLGDSFNYFLGRHFGERLFSKSKFYRKEYVLKTQQFYEKHGQKTIILARFIPIVRTFAPFIAGITKMNYVSFLLYNIIGGIIWVSLFTLGGYFLGNIPFIQENFSLFILIIIFSSFIPLFIEIINHYRRKHRSSENSSSK